MKKQLPKILIVDDLPANLRAMQKILSKTQADVIEASSGAEALILCSEQDFALLLLDVNMPNMNGFEVAEALHGVERTKNLPIIFVTAAATDENQALKGFQSGAVDFILKPINDRILFSKVNVFLELYKKRRELEEKNHELERLQNILLLMMDALFFISPEGTITGVNQDSLFGYRDDELVGQPIGKLFVEQAHAFRKTPLSVLIQAGSVNNAEVTLVARDGHLVPVLVSSSVVKDSREEVTGIILVVKDITEYKNAQKSLREKEAQLIHTGRLTAMGEMASGIAHELNQPLTVIRIWSQSLGQEAKKGKVVQGRVLHATEEITQQTNRAAAIIGHMGAFARVETRDAIEAVDLALPANEALMFFREQFRIHEIQLDIQLDQDLPKIRMYANRFEQIIVNLLSNARYAVDKKGDSNKEFEKTIVLRLFSDSERRHVVLEVEDNGIGMSKEEHNRCLEPFFTTKEVGKGTGLGLHIIRGIVDEVKGSVEVESRQGEGSVLRVLLPVGDNG